jgi:hypothetical protein
MSHARGHTSISPSVSKAPSGRQKTKNKRRSTSGSSRSSKSSRSRSGGPVRRQELKIKKQY